MALSQPAAASAPAVTREASALDTSRVVIAHDTGVLVLNSRTLATLDTFRTLARPALSPAGDGRHVFLTPAGTGTVRILDAGDPAKRGAERRPGLEPGMLNGLQPAHVNSEHGRTAVFDDGTGVIQVVADDQLSGRTLSVRTFAPFPAHHGVAVPLAKGYLVSVPAQTSSVRVGVARMTENGRIAKRWDTCPGLHGEAHAKGGVVAFGCDDGIFTDKGGVAAKIAEPTGVAGRVSTLAGSEESTVLAANYTSTQLLLADTANGTTRLVDLGMTYGTFTRDEHGDVVVLGTDGKVRTIDAGTGEIESSVTATPAWEVPASSASPRPRMTMVGHHAVVTDPRSERVVQVDLERERISRSVTLPVVPVSVLATGGAHQH